MRMTTGVDCTANIVLCETIPRNFFFYPPNTGSTSLLMNLLKNYTAGIVAVSDHFFLLLMVQLSKQHRLLIITVYHLQSLYVDFSSTDSTVSQLARLERDVAAKC